MQELTIRSKAHYVWLYWAHWLSIWLQGVQRTLFKSRYLHKRLMRSHVFERIRRYLGIVRELLRRERNMPATGPCCLLLWSGTRIFNQFQCNLLLIYMRVSHTIRIQPYSSGLFVVLRNLTRDISDDRTLLMWFEPKKPRALHRRYC